MKNVTYLELAHHLIEASSRKIENLHAFWDQVKEFPFQYIKEQPELRNLLATLKQAGK